MVSCSRLMSRLGIKGIIVTNAAGGLNSNLEVGDVMVCMHLTSHKGQIIEFEFAALCKALVQIYFGSICQGVALPSAQANLQPVTQKIS